MQRGELIAGRYELVKRLGRGGMGEVWAARDRTLRRDVAVKTLHLDGSVHPDLPLRFEREAVAAAQISHPNVVALFDRGVHEDLWFLVMERVDGTDLADHIRGENPMEPARALDIAREICAALVAAHQAHVIHYDIKPHNVMLTPDGRVKVVDFGIAGFLGTVFTLAPSSQLTPAGTPQYGAPEQFLTERGDARSDLYALGSVLFALLTGGPPFDGHSSFAIMQRKLTEDAPSLGELRPDLPVAVAYLVDQLLERDPDRRPQTAAAVHERLDRLRTGLADPHVPHEATVTSRSSRTPAPPPTRRQPLAAGAFEVSWSGQEPITDYAPLTRRPSGTVLRVLVVWAITVAACWPLATGAVAEWDPAEGGQRNTAWVVLAMVAAFGALAGLLCLLPLVEALRLWPLLRRSGGTPWTLTVGPQGIATTGGVISCAVAWDQVEAVTRESVRAAVPYTFTGLHVRLAKDSHQPLRDRPAGWPYADGPTRRGDGKVPFCVLGPLTAQQHVELAEALTRHGGPLWFPLVS
ncbi:protein kinase [Streptomyces goshikiensis]|uniref:serine/threonine-protein kinase n=1 Tax=Streptomyces goshikiensis TaxID=1942 RepID=UPI0037A038F2